MTFRGRPTAVGTLWPLAQFALAAGGALTGHQGPCPMSPARWDGETLTIVWEMSGIMAESTKMENSKGLD